MNATRPRTHRLFRSWTSIVAAAALLGSGTVFVTSGPVLATLAGSHFNGADGSVTGDLAAGAIEITDPVAGADTTNYSGGSTDDDICPTVATGTAPNASDIDHFYFGTQSNASGVFVYLGWHRFTTTGTTTLDFELNKSSADAPSCGSHQPERTAGDLLITYDFTGGGGTVTLSSRSWVGTATAGAWSAPTTLTTNAEASINAAGDFGEMVINATGAGVLPTGTCTSFAGAFAKSRASVTFNSQIKDFTTRATATISNCGSVSISKTDDANPANPLTGAVFKLFTDVANAPGVAVAGMTCTTAAAGTCTIGSVVPGTYWIVEDTVPAGHTGPAAAQKVTVALAGNTPAGPYVFVNPRRAGSVTITKEDDLGAPVDGAVLTLYTDNAGAPGTAVPGMFCATVAGACTISNVLPAGNYWVVETVTPAGYSTATSMPVTVTLGGNTPVTLVDNRRPGTITIVKRNEAGAALAGATFGLFADNAGVIGTAVAGKTCTSGTAGTCSITSILPAGTYWVRETTTPAGHTTAADQKVNVALGQTVTLNFVNVRHPVSISLTKLVNGVHPSATSPLLVAAGSTLSYTLTITNTGSLPLTIDQLADTLEANVASRCTQGPGSTLAPAASFTCAYTSTATRPETNIASVAAVDQFGRFVTADDTTSVKPVNAQVGLSKTGPANAHVGDTVEYTLTVTTGDHPLTDVVVTDPACAAAPVLETKTGGDQDDVLEPGEVWTYTCSHVVTAADGSSLTNTATVHALDPLRRAVTSEGKHTLTILHPGLKITKTADPASVPVAGTVTFTYVVTNTGDTPLRNVTVTDDVLGAIGVVASLAPGASRTFTKTMTVDASSPVTNVGKAVGTDALGMQVSDSAAVTITIVLGTVLRRAPELPKTGSDIAGLLMLGGSLVLLGAVLLFSGRRRPRRSDQ